MAEKGDESLDDAEEKWMVHLLPTVSASEGDIESWSEREYSSGAVIFLRRGEKTPYPCLIFYWTWQIDCVVAMNSCQSLSSCANHVEWGANRFQHLSAPPYAFSHSWPVFILGIFLYIIELCLVVDSQKFFKWLLDRILYRSVCKKI